LTISNANISKVIDPTKNAIRQKKHPLATKIKRQTTGLKQDK